MNLATVADDSWVLCGECASKLAVVSNTYFSVKGAATP